MADPTLPLPGLSPIAGKAIVARFDGGRLSSDAGLLALREIERRLSVSPIVWPPASTIRAIPASTVHRLADIIRFRLLMIAAGYEDGNDATGLRLDPVFKMALERLPSGRDLCSQSTISRLENLPDARTLLRLGRALVDLYCASFRQVPKRITLDIDDTFDAVHGGQQLRLFNAHYDDYGFQPIVVFDQRWSLRHRRAAPGETAQGRRDPGLSAPPGRARSAPTGRRWRSCCAPTATTAPGGARLVRGERRRFILGLAPDQHAHAPYRRLEASTRPVKADSIRGKVRRFKEFHDGAASWSRVERIVARVEAGREGTDTRFIVTNLDHGNGRSLYQDLYCQRGQAENHIKAWKTAPRRRPHLVPQGHRQPVPPVPPCRRLLAAVEPARADAQALGLACRPIRHAQLRLVKIAARVVQMKTKIKIYMLTRAPDQSIFRLVLGRLTRLVT